MRVLYSIVFYACTPLILLHFAIRGRKDRRYLQRWKERFGIYGQAPAPGGIVVHAASVGEFNAAQPLITALLNSEDRLPLTVTTFTPTGSARAQSLSAHDVAHCYAPLDLPGAVRRFLDHVNPALLIIIETEIWPNLYAEANRRGIPILMANARISGRSWRSYRKFRGLVGDTLARVAQVAAQSPSDAERLVALGADPARVVAAGNLKFDIEPPDGVEEGAPALRRQWWEDRPVVIAGSTHEADDTAVLNAFAELLKLLPDTLLILVPRHPERFAPAAVLASGMGFRTELHSDGEACSPDAQVFVIDAMGELYRYYACSDVAVIGGSFGDTGGHNALEAAALGRPVVLGPNMQNFAEITEAMLAAGAAVQVRDSACLGRVLAGLLRDPGARAKMGNAGRQLVEQGRGALLETMQMVEKLVS
jgi:3-deoxy-D-manno-octulosonic-acid transferase